MKKPTKIISLSEYEYAQLETNGKIEPNTIYHIQSSENNTEKDVIVIERTMTRRLYSVFEILAMLALNLSWSYLFVQLFK